MIHKFSGAGKNSLALLYEIRYITSWAQRDRHMFISGHAYDVTVLLLFTPAVSAVEFEHKQHQSFFFPHFSFLLVTWVMTDAAPGASQPSLVSMGLEDGLQMSRETHHDSLGMISRCSVSRRKVRVLMQCNVL